MGGDGRHSNGSARQRPDEAAGWLAWVGWFWSVHLDALRRYLDKMDQLDTNEGGEEQEDD